QHLLDVREKFLLMALLADRRRRMPLVVIEAAHQQRQLGAEMRRVVERQAVAQSTQTRSENMPGDMSVGTHAGHDFVEPDVRRLHCLVEYVEPGGAHLSPPRENARGTGRSDPRPIWLGPAAVC